MSAPMPAPGAPFHVAIVGGGIGGLALAVGLLRQNVSFTLYEAAKAFSTIGAGVGLGPNALRAMEAIAPGFLPKYDAISSGNVTPGKDHVMMDAMLCEEGFGVKRGFRPRPYGAQSYKRTSAHRKDLLDILTSYIPADVVQFGMRADKIEQRGDKVVITFNGGSEVVEADAVIGCDGIRGLSRATVLGASHPDLVAAKFSGKYVYRAVIPMEDAKQIMGRDEQGNEIAGDAKMFMGTQSVITTFPISKGKECNMVCFRLIDEPWTDPEWTIPVEREEMQKDLESVGVDKRLIKLLDWAKPRVRWAIFDHLVTPIYFDRRVCLLGDSAHATTPHQASGAGQCIEDALVLSSLLAAVTGPGQLTAAFAAYDAVRRPRAQRVCQTSREAGDIYALKGPSTGADLDKILDNLNGRHLWIWDHDLLGDVQAAKDRFAALVRDQDQDGAADPGPPPSRFEGAASTVEGVY